jgi:hypothetical protein
MFVRPAVSRGGAEPGGVVLTAVEEVLPPSLGWADRPGATYS